MKDFEKIAQTQTDEKQCEWVLQTGELTQVYIPLLTEEQIGNLRYITGRE